MKVCTRDVAVCTAPVAPEVVGYLTGGLGGYSSARYLSTKDRALVVELKV